MPAAGLLSPAQCRAARGLLGWSQDDLALKAGVARSTVRDFETSRHGLQGGTEKLLTQALTAAGVILIAAGQGCDCEGGAGVRLRPADET